MCKQPVARFLNITLFLVACSAAEFDSFADGNSRFFFDHSYSGSPRVAVCLFGLTRSLNITRHSFRRHVLDVLTSHGYAYDIFLHTYKKSTLTNPRSQEDQVRLDVNEWRFLRPTRVLSEEPDEVDKDYVWPLLEKALTRGDRWRENNSNHSSMANLLRQLRSIEKVTDLLVKETLENGKHYDAVIFARPDVWFFNDINVHEIKTVGSYPSILYSPKAHATAKPDEVNDRFAICHMRNAMVWGHRSQLIDEYVFELNHTLHAESLMGYALQKADVDVRLSSTQFARVRANNVLWLEPLPGSTTYRPQKMFRNSLGSWTI